MIEKEKNNRDRRSARSTVASLFYQIIAIELEHNVIERLGKAFTRGIRLADIIDMISRF